MDASLLSTPDEFYFACRNNDIDTVKHYLKILTLEQINRLQANNSTALHAAAYYARCEIVKLLLERGASRSISNKYGYTAMEEAADEDVQKMFNRISIDHRFGGDHSEPIEWIKVDSNAHHLAAVNRQSVNDWNNHTWIQMTIDFITSDYINQDLADVQGIDEIKWFFNKAKTEQDPVYILKAYSAETGFYTRLNTQLAVDQLTDGHEQDNSWWGRHHILRIIVGHPRLEKYVFIGMTFRGMNISSNDLAQYNVGTRLMTKSFLSTSKNQSIAEAFAICRSVDHKTDINLPALCIYTIKNRRTAYDIEKISEYSPEKEVLVIPYSAFIVKGMEQHQLPSENGIMVTIELEECDASWSNNQTVSSGRDYCLII